MELEPGQLISLDPHHYPYNDFDFAPEHVERLTWNVIRKRGLNNELIVDVMVVPKEADKPISKMRRFVPSNILEENGLKNHITVHR